MEMETRDVLYAAVGAPVVAVRKVGKQVADWRERMSEGTNSYSKSAEKTIEGWAAEGKKVVDQISNGYVVEEISSKVDLDQAKEQVGKLRDQLEDMLDTWRASFRPEKAEPAPAKQPARPAAAKPAAKKPAAKTGAAKKPAAKTPGAKKTPAKSTTSGQSQAKTDAKKSA
jgi:hypothetical protein